MVLLHIKAEKNMGMLAIKVPMEVGRLLQQITVPGKKEAPSEYHITVLYFEDDFKISDVAKSLEAAYDILSNFSPFKVKLQEVSKFETSDDEETPVILKVESKQLMELNKKLKEKFDENNVKFSKKYKEFKPHITLSYAENNDVKDFFIEPLEFYVHELTLWGGNFEKTKVFIDFQLKGPEIEKNSNVLSRVNNYYKYIKK